MYTTASRRLLTLRLAAPLVFSAASLTLGLFGCAAEADEDLATSSDELRSHAGEAGLSEWSAEGRGVVAVANDRSLGVDDYVFRVKVSRKTAEAIIATRNGINGSNESRPILECSGHGSSGSSGSSGWSGSSGGSSSGWSGSGGGPPPPPPTATASGYPSPPPPPTATTPGYFPPPPPMCTTTWQLGGDDEEFARLSELDALPGTDVVAFRNLRLFAYQHGYIRPVPPPFPGSDAGVPQPPPPPPVTDSGPPPPPPVTDAGPAPF